ncbi:hypothetical protein FAM18129_00540 [Lacticaseibacillus paracasei]|uniref:hypothetical protein n=1 Tax=Lacticaseibacillus paracasei TaxID=1597 RepID=UPI000FEEDD8E|nr:hypothetical protein [Lacticaseibacillus paracasei]RND72503.1 hypothetical protein FAM18129_00540 [Lacticaseibacillus paracasei]
MNYKRWLIAIISLLSVLLVISMTGHTTVHADTLDPVEQAYRDGVSSGKIDPAQYSKSAFRYNYQQGLNIYTVQVKAGGVHGSYLDWLKDVNYGAMPDGSGVGPNEPKMEPRSANDYISRFLRDIQKGDILIVNGGFGHAAIATTNNFILEMTGGGNIVNWTVTGIPDNNQQYTTSDWIDKHKNDHVQIWRPRQGIGATAADYADYKFYSSTHSSNKDRHITYGLGAGPLVFDPNYCSKLVWQSFWFGTGNKNVVTGTPFFILPGSLPTFFTSGYTPYKVGSY